MSEIVQGKPLDKNQSKTVHIKKTKFDKSKHYFNTYRFGEYGIITAQVGIANDYWKIISESAVDSYTLKAPLMTPIHMNKDFYLVSRMAMIPRAFEKIDTQPSIGQDIDATKYGTSIKAEYFNNYLTTIDGYWSTLYTTDTTSFTLTDYLKHIQKTLHTLVLMEQIWSEGSLLNTLGCHIARTWIGTFGKIGQNFDQMFEAFVSHLPSGIMEVQDVDTNEYWNVVIPGQNNVTEDAIRLMSQTNKVILWNAFWLKMKDGMRIKITKWTNITGTNTYTDSDMAFAYENLKSFISICSINTFVTRPIDSAKLWAYHISCAEFYTNDKVDYIYNAELYRQYIENLIIAVRKKVIGVNAGLPTYTINGIEITTDGMCGENFNTITSNLNPEDISEDRNSNTSVPYRYDYLIALFKYERSLKYKDYFVGSRTRPLAIGNTQIAVNNNLVEVVDVSAKIQLQRFLNIVNKIPRDLKGYTKGIFGKDVAPDWHNPMWLASMSDKIFGNQTENTGEAQLTQAVSRTITLNNVGKNIQLNVELDRKAIIIGICSFEIERSYSMGIERDFNDVDRYDWFNPYLQYTGDQEVYQSELDSNGSGVFGYQGAYMNMKQSYNEAAGGFITALKGWTFLDRYVDTTEGQTYLIADHQGPDFIRSKSTELDKFYISLSGRSMANYFHFIIENNNVIEVTRPMAYNPQILG